eukprot:GHVS01045692.1.p1 GENE.GHVS01045692.1~~GHVS01045692.1.p1  ORF type:complete len:298 (-),score=77.87 GHVS01045692.1:18-815(-)
MHSATVMGSAQQHVMSASSNYSTPQQHVVSGSSNYSTPQQHVVSASSATTTTVEGCYTECTLQGLVSDLENFNGLMDCLKGTSDSHIADVQWVDQCWRRQQQTLDKLTEVNFLVHHQRQQQELWVRHYLRPTDLTKFSCLRAFSSAHVVKAHKKTTSNVRRVCESVVSPNMTTLLANHMGYRLNHEIFVQADIFHTKYGNASHIITLVQRHFQDRQFSSESRPCTVLVEVKGRLMEDNLLAAVEANLKIFADSLQPYVAVRKVDL